MVYLGFHKEGKFSLATSAYTRGQTMFSNFFLGKNWFCLPRGVMAQCPLPFKYATASCPTPEAMVNLGDLESRKCWIIYVHKSGSRIWLSSGHRANRKRIPRADHGHRISRLKFEYCDVGHADTNAIRACNAHSIFYHDDTYLIK